MKRVVFCVCLTAVLFGTMEVALKLAGSSLDPVQLTCLRFLIGGIILAPFGYHELRAHNTVLGIRDLLWLVLVGTMGIPVSMLLFQLGVLRCNAATAAALVCLNPLFTMLIAHLFTPEKMNRDKWISFVIGLIAAFFLIRPWDVQTGNTPLGIALMLLAAVTFAAYTVMGKRSISRIGTFAQTSISFFAGSLILMVVLLLTHRPLIAGVADNCLVVAYVSIFVTGIGYLSYFLAIRCSDASTGSIAFFIKPLIAPIFAMLLLGEAIYWNTIVGIALLVTASFFTFYSTWREKQQHEQIS